jgi:hypothetical protein
MTALPLEARHTTRAMAEPAALPSSEDPLQPGTERITSARHHSPSYALDLSRSRTHHAVLDILKVYKLSGNFHGNLEIVLKDMGVVDMVSYQIESNPSLALPDCRHVVFTLNENVPGDRFDDTIANIKDRIGFHAPWWVRQLCRLQPRAASLDQVRRGDY